MWLANHASEWIHGDSFALLTPAFAAKYAHKLHAILLFQGFVFYTGIKPESSQLHRAQLAALLCFYEKINDALTVRNDSRRPGW